MDGTLRVQAPRERDEVGGSHNQSTEGVLSVGGHSKTLVGLVCTYVIAAIISAQFAPVRCPAFSVD